MKKKDNPVTKMFPSFDNIRGKCSLEAISFTFKLDVCGVKSTLKKVGWKETYEGTTFHQCDKAIKLLSAIHLKKVLYHSNKNKLNVHQFLRNYQKGIFILNQEGHLSAIKNGVAYDNYSPDNYKILGWWEIKEKYGIELCTPRQFKFTRITRTRYELGSVPEKRVAWRK